MSSMSHKIETMRSITQHCCWGGIVDIIMTRSVSGSYDWISPVQGYGVYLGVLCQPPFSTMLQQTVQNTHLSRKTDHYRGILAILFLNCWAKITLHHNPQNPPNTRNLVYCGSQLCGRQAVPIKSYLEIRTHRTAGYLCYRQAADLKWKKKGWGSGRGWERGALFAFY